MSENLDDKLYNHLITSVQNWFETGNGNGVSYFHIFKFGNGKSFHLDNVWLGGKKRNAEFCVTICSSDSICEHYIMHLSLKFNDKLQADFNHDVELQGDILRVIHDIYNVPNPPNSVISYSSIEDKIHIFQELYFYPGSMPPQEEIFRLIEDFIHRDYVNQIADIIADNAWKDPLPYLIEQLKDERKY
ncbi:MAG: hypothetical protein J5621_06210 [Paludibacteraceae bacterium]|nr:hypothetical protein [Paludibacteraceae bacterium]